MLYELKYPNAAVSSEPEPNLLRIPISTETPCQACGRHTEYLDLETQSPVCSDECRAQVIAADNQVCDGRQANHDKNPNSPLLTFEDPPPKRELWTNEDAQEQLQDLINRIGAGDYEKAMKIFNSVKDLSPGDGLARAYELLGGQFISSDDSRQLLSRLQKL